MTKILKQIAELEAKAKMTPKAVDDFERGVDYGDRRTAIQALSIIDNLINNLTKSL